jgi:hypothetical protein
LIAERMKTVSNGTEASAAAVSPRSSSKIDCRWVTAAQPSSEPVLPRLVLSHLARFYAIEKS